MKRRMWTRIAAAAAALLIGAGCAKPPMRELEAKRQQAQQAIDKSEAKVYAPEAVRRVQDALAGVDAGIAAQSRRLPFLRKYDDVVASIQNVDTAIDDMQREAQMRRETLRTEANTNIQQAIALADSVENESHGTPAIKGGRTLVGLIQGELNEVRGLVEQSKSSLAADQIAPAAEQARAASDRARKLLDEVRNTRSKVQALRAHHAG